MDIETEFRRFADFALFAALSLVAAGGFAVLIEFFRDTRFEDLIRVIGAGGFLLLIAGAFAVALKAAPSLPWLRPLSKRERIIAGGITLFIVAGCAVFVIQY